MCAKREGDIFRFPNDLRVLREGHQAEMFPEEPPMPLGTGSPDSTGHTGEPSPSDQDAPTDAGDLTHISRVGVTPVRVHKGHTRISVGSLTLHEEIPGSFSALRVGPLGAYTVTLSCVLTSSRYGALVAALERPATALGSGVSVALEFEPTTPNLVPPTTAPNI